jgi:hypothetical protein
MSGVLASVDKNGARNDLGSEIRSQGLNPLYRSARSFRTAFQNAVLADSKNRGPQVVIASRPAGRAIGESARSCTIMTTEPNDLIATLHDRMPVS